MMRTSHNFYLVKHARACTSSARNVVCIFENPLASGIMVTVAVVDANATGWMALCSRALSSVCVCEFCTESRPLTSVHIHNRPVLIADNQLLSVVYTSKY